MDYNVLTKTCLQGPNKLKNYRLRWLSKPLRLAKFESLWIKVCSIVAVFGIPGNISLLSLSFDKVFSMILLWFTIAECPSMLAVFPFYSVILSSEVPLIPLFGSPGYQSPCCASHSEGWSFPCSSLFSPFGAVSLKVPCWLSILRCP